MKQYTEAERLAILNETPDAEPYRDILFTEQEIAEFEAFRSWAKEMAQQLKPALDAFQKLSEPTPTAQPK